MYITTEGIILRQYKLTSGRRMISVFTKKYGKIGAGSNITEKSKAKGALSIRPFTLGNYEMYKNRDYFNINGGDVIKSFFAIGEDIDKYMNASFVLELTDRILQEGDPQPKLFNLLVDFLQAMVRRKGKYETLVLAYESKALAIMGAMPVLGECACCGCLENLNRFSIADGGIICENCGEKSKDTLIYEPKFDIVDVLKYFLERPFQDFEKIALDSDVAAGLQTILREYMSYHLDIQKLKSEIVLKESVRR